MPSAMTLEAAEVVVAAAEARGVTFGLCHPMRLQPEYGPIRAAAAEGRDSIRHVAGRFFINRLSNVGATGYHRSCTANILWPHFHPFVDLSLWLFDFHGDVAYTF